MSEPALYKRKTKSGKELPTVTLEELQAMRRAGRNLQPDVLIQVIGVRSFVSDEEWLPASDYPELAEHFPEVAGRAIIKAEVKRAKVVRKYVIAATTLCLLAAFLFWWMPYRDAEDARGNLGRLTIELDSARTEAAKLHTHLKSMQEVAERRQKDLERTIEDERQKLYDVTEKLKLAQDSVKKLLLSGEASSVRVSELQARNEQLSSRLNEAEQIPKFWPGADVLRAPADTARVRLVSMIPDRGYVYVIGRNSYAKDTVLLVRQPGIYGTRIHLRVIKTYDHGNGEVGLSLLSPDQDEAAAKKITSLGYGEILDCNLVSKVK
jgi:hypothetical protein